MGYSIGFDEKWNRDIGYGVPALCDHPECNEEIDRGVSYLCGDLMHPLSRGCGLHFCEDHLEHYSEINKSFCERCSPEMPYEPFTPKPDIAEWRNHKLKDESWSEWRAENPKAVISLTAQSILFSVDAFATTTTGQAQYLSCHQLNIKHKWHEKDGITFTFDDVEYETLEDLLTKNPDLAIKASNVNWTVPVEQPERTIKEKLAAMGIDLESDLDQEWLNAVESVTFFQVIRRWRIKNQVSLGEMAKKLGMGAADLSSYETGKTPLDKSLILSVRANYPELDTAELTQAYIFSYKQQQTINKETT